MKQLAKQTFDTEQAAWVAVEDVFGPEGGFGSGYEVFVFQNTEGKWYATW